LIDRVHVLFIENYQQHRPIDMVDSLCWWRFTWLGTTQITCARQWRQGMISLLATKNSELLLENIAGWRPECSWLGHGWVCLAADCGSKVCSFRQWVVTNCAAYC